MGKYDVFMTHFGDFLRDQKAHYWVMSIFSANKNEEFVLNGGGQFLYPIVDVGNTMCPGRMTGKPSVKIQF